jgi:hypothetical protein
MVMRVKCLTAVKVGRSNGATTFSIMTFNMSFSIMTFSIMTLSTMECIVKLRINEIQLDDT